MRRGALAVLGLASSAALAAGYALPWIAGVSGYASVETKLPWRAAGGSTVAVWRATAALRIGAGLAVAAFFAGLSATLADVQPRSGGLSWVVAGAGGAWGLAWTLSGLWVQAALHAAPVWAADAAQTMSIETLHVLTPSLTLAALVGVAATAGGSDVFPAAFVKVTWGVAGLRLVLALWDWAGTGGLSAGLMDIGILWVAAAGFQLLRATKARGVPA